MLWSETCGAYMNNFGFRALGAKIIKSRYNRGMDITTLLAAIDAINLALLISKLSYIVSVAKNILATKSDIWLLFLTPRYWG